MSEMTNKERCIAMWEWLAENPKKNKPDYLDKINDTSLINHFDCYACKEVGTYYNPNDIFQDDSIDNCDKCPIKWPTFIETGYHCVESGSPYDNWEISDEGDELKEKTKYALEMVDLIKETWK